MLEYLIKKELIRDIFILLMFLIIMIIIIYIYIKNFLYNIKKKRGKKK